VRQDRRGESAFGGVGSEILVAAVEWCLNRGIEDVVLEYHPVWIARFIGLGFKVRPLGLPTEIDGDPVVAVEMHFDERALDLSREICGVHRRVLADRFQHAPVAYAKRGR
jgi:acyl-homoserine lactone synthase